LAVLRQVGDAPTFWFGMAAPNPRDIGLDSRFRDNG
jgi:hypothetical protein